MDSRASPRPLENMGEPTARVDARLKVTGAARYPADEPADNLAHAVMVISTIARGKVLTVDTAEAEAVSGVLAVYTTDNIGDALDHPDFGTGGMTSVQPLKTHDIHHDGQMVAMVVAETFETATEAAERVQVTYQREEPSSGFGSPGTEEVGAAESSEDFDEDPQAGDFDGAFTAARHKIDAVYSTPTQHHNPIELFSTTASWEDDKLTVQEPTQNVIGWRKQLAGQLRMDLEKIRVVSRYIGGAFGSKGPITPRTAVVALAAKRLGRPVRCVATRHQGYTTATYRAETRHRIRMAAGEDGKITAFSHEGWEVTSRPDNYVVGGTETTARLYGYGAVHTKVRLVKADRNTPGYMRSPPELPYVYALEHAMDEMAEKLGIDPVRFRLINDTMNEPIDGKPYSSRPLAECYERVGQSFGWTAERPPAESLRDGDWLVGWGCATAVYPTQVSSCTARVRLSADGKILAESAVQEIGTGVRTVMAQFTAQELGAAVEDVEVAAGDSALPAAPVAGGSRSTASVCAALQKACAAIRTKLFEAAARTGSLAGQNSDAFELTAGKIRAPSGAEEELKAVMVTIGAGMIEEYGEFTPEGTGKDAIQKLYRGQPSSAGGSKGDTMKYAFGAEMVEVRINARTREIRVPRIAGAFAAGRIINPRTSRSQLLGGMIWGISSALFEKTEIDTREARYLNRDLQDYLVPVNADVPNVEVILVSEIDADVTPAGVKGLGELGNVGTAAAIASAVRHATGKRIRDLPILIDDLIE